MRISFRPTVATVMAVLGGGLAFAGTFPEWFDASISFRGESPRVGSFAGDEVTTASGTDDWTGIIVLMLGLLIAAAAIGAMLLIDGRRRRILLRGVAMGGILVFVMLMLAWIRAEDWVGSKAVEQYPEVWAPFITDFRVAIGLTVGWWISAIGAVAAVIGGVLGLTSERDPVDV